MVRVGSGSRPPSWSQNQVKVLVDAESSLYSSSIETPGPARPWRENVLRPRSSAGLPRLYPFWILPSDLFPFLCLKALISLFVSSRRAALLSPEPPLRRLGRPWRWLGALVVLDRVGLAGCSICHWSRHSRHRSVKNLAQPRVVLRQRYVKPYCDSWRGQACNVPPIPYPTRG